MASTQTEMYWPSRPYRLWPRPLQVAFQDYGAPLPQSCILIAPVRSARGGQDAASNVIALVRALGTSYPAPQRRLCVLMVQAKIGCNSERVEENETLDSKDASGKHVLHEAKRLGVHSSKHYLPESAHGGWLPHAMALRRTCVNVALARAQ